MTTDFITLSMLGLLVLIAIVGAACFYAGWKSAAAYLPAARAVSEVSNAAVSQANNFSAALDSVEKTMSSLRSAIDTNTKTLEERNRAVEESLYHLFQGLERAGLARPPGRAPARQVGDPPADA